MIISEPGPSVSLTNIHRWKNGEYSPTEDPIATEAFLQIYVNGSIYGSLDCSPHKLDELVVGYLYTDGLIQSYSDISSLVIQGDKVYANIKPDSSCAAPVFDPEQPLHLSAASVTQLIRQLEDSSILFKHTGGVHNTALTDGHTILASCEDIGRRNALDRLAGHCLIHGISMDGRAILFSGRIPEEVVRKASYMKCSAILSISAPTSLAVRAADEENILLIGFIRGERFNVYTFPERITL